MLIIPYVDIFSCPKGNTEAMCVTTNGMIRKDGHAVMGKGIARTVNDKYDVSLRLAAYLRQYGNVPFDLGIHDNFHVLSFPTKNDWQNDSSIELIIQSAQKLMTLADELGLTKIYVPKPGCANGHLDWESQVKPAIENILDNRFIVIQS